jgi:hypothetical protein
MAAADTVVLAGNSTGSGAINSRIPWSIGQLSFPLLSGPAWRNKDPI